MLIKPVQSEGVIIYNITTSVAGNIADEWVHWMVYEHGPEVIATKCFTKFQLLKLLHLDDAEGQTFAVQYYAEDISLYNRYINDFAPAMRQKVNDKWGDKLVAFRTVMEVIC
jgi:hypothetical protein